MELPNVSPDTEPHLRRLAYLHEAGHAVVAIDIGLIIQEVVCNGETGHCDARFTGEDDAALAEAARSNKGNPSVGSFQTLIDVYSPKLVALLGGIAGESLLLGRPIYTTRRASDDFVNFFGFLAMNSRALTPPQGMPLFQEIFEQSQDRAWSIVRERKNLVERLADRLEACGSLSKLDVSAIAAP